MELLYPSTKFPNSIRLSLEPRVGGVEDDDGVEISKSMKFEEEFDGEDRSRERPGSETAGSPKSAKYRSSGRSSFGSRPDDLNFLDLSSSSYRKSKKNSQNISAFVFPHNFSHKKYYSIFPHFFFIENTSDSSSSTAAFLS